ncbi:hypothetical protein HK097_003165 [Rhizophlyctis rosea]|uniref:BTB domain-containing protein n=1 Tax=Rhizophlyctis rosea TaxID=64517 RepID=A0AAD5SA31_9FUNG|nr:hypothetical protein HK097_003165 [Rhizophlyctis rosea]
MVRAPFPPNDRFLSKHQYSDVILELESLPISVIIPAHRLILPASSDFFRSKFDFDQRSRPFADNQPTKCIIEGFSESCARAMLEFMYTQQIVHHMPRFLNLKVQIISLCEVYQVSGMHEYIAPYILQHISPENAVKILETGHKFRAMSDALARGACEVFEGQLDAAFGERGVH